MKPVYQKLKAARQNILDYGWRQYGMGDKEHGFCALGAICAVTTNGKPLVSKLKEAIGVNRLTGWNDTSGRTKEEVVEAFSKAMRLAR